MLLTDIELWLATEELVCAEIEWEPVSLARSFIVLISRLVHMQRAEALLVRAHRKATRLPGLNMHSDSGLAVVSALLETLMDLEVVGARMYIFKEVDHCVLTTEVNMVWRCLIGNDGLHSLHKLRMTAHLAGRVLHSNSEPRLEDGL